jgi:hypothetical protein
MREERHQISRALKNAIDRVRLGMVFTTFSVLSMGQQQIPDRPDEQRPNDHSDQQVLVQFSKQSARQLVARYFRGPPYPLFVIRRLIDLDNSAVLPDLREAFSHEMQPLTRQALAAALVRLRDPDPQYFDYLSASAREAVTSDIPYSCDLSEATMSEGRTGSQLQLIAWAQGHGVAFSDALRTAAIELPGTIEALGEAADHRALKILLRGLKSPDGCIVRTSAFGLARLHDPIAIEPIIEACNSRPREERPLTAKAVLYFHSPDAQRATDFMIDPVLVRRWRIEVNHRGWKFAMRDRAIP